jgi:hypothetical protein
VPSGHRLSAGIRQARTDRDSEGVRVSTCASLRRGGWVVRRNGFRHSRLHHPSGARRRTRRMAGWRHVRGGRAQPGAATEGRDVRSRPRRSASLAVGAAVSLTVGPPGRERTWEGHII